MLVCDCDQCVRMNSLSIGSYVGLFSHSIKIRDLSEYVYADLQGYFCIDKVQF